MPLNAYDTYVLIAAIHGLDDQPSFLRDRYFPTSAADVFTTEKVLVEYRDGDLRLAPYVVDGSSGMAVSRAGQRMEEYAPPTVMPQRRITLDDIKKRGFGEALYGANITPEQRERLLAIRDMDELTNMIVRREEQMAAETLLNNGCKMFAYTDRMEPTLVNEIHFYDGAVNPAKMVFDKDWDEPDADIYGNIGKMIENLTRRGLPASDLLVAPDVSDAILNNEKIYKLLDNRRIEVGGISPELITGYPGAALTCTLNIEGNVVNIISYNKVYTDDEGKIQQYIPAGNVVMTAPAAGHTLYGCVSQVEQYDGEFHSYPGERRVPKYLADAQHNVRTLSVSSRPVMAPWDVNPWITSKVITGD